MLTFLVYLIEMHYGYDFSEWIYVLPVITDLTLIRRFVK